MKATDLMLGDWVLCDGKPYQVAEISAGLLCIDAERELFADPEDVEPIPITPEILEKNGFELRREKVWRWISEDERTGIIFVFGADHIYIFKNAYYEDEVEFSLPCPNCVHQIQHALRLCGIEKEIVL